jgi:hypothetical protein
MTRTVFYFLLCFTTSFAKAQIIIQPNTENFLLLTNEDSNCVKKFCTLLNNIKNLETPDSELYKEYKQEKKMIHNNAFFPASKLKDTEDLFSNNIAKDNSIAVTLLQSGGSLFTELYVDYMGDMRVSIAAGATQTDSTGSETQLDNIQNFLSTGGNLLMRADMIMFLWSGRDTSRKNFFTCLLSPRLGGSIPEVSSEIEEPAGYFDLGIEVQYKVTGSKELISLNGGLRTGILAVTEQYAATLSRNNRTLIGYGKFNFGLDIAGYIISLNMPISLIGDSDPIDEWPVSLSVGLNL